MSQANLELVRDAIEAWNQQDHDAVVRIFSPDAELDASGRVMNPDVYRGLDGFMRFRSDIAEAWDRFEVEMTDLFDSGDLVLVFIRSTGRGRGSGVDVDLRSAWLVSVVDKQITRLRLYRNREEALQAARLDG
jgi:ketosteroid isomerase-like protein